MVTFVGWLVGLLVVGKKCGKIWKLTEAMCKTKTTEPELIVQLPLLIYKVICSILSKSESCLY